MIAIAKYKKRPDGRYRATVSTGMINEAGKRVLIYVYGKSIAELERKKAKVMMDLDRGAYVFEKKTLFRDYKWHWLELYKASRSTNTRSGYYNILKNHTAAIDDIPLIDIRASDVQRGYNELSGHADLQRRYYQTVNQILNRAIADSLIYKNVCVGIEKEKYKKKKKRALTQNERMYLFRADLDEKERLLAYLLFYTGMRKQEIIPLTKNDIDLKRCRIRVNKAVTFDGEKAVLKDTKSDSGDREIYILDNLLPVLKNYLKDMDGTYLFPGSKGGYLTKSQYRNLFGRIKRKLNDAMGGSYHWENGRCVYDVDKCEGLGSHTFRHEFATMLYYSGIDVMEAVRMMGHADSRMLLDVYAELRAQEDVSVSKMNSYLEKVLDF